MEIASHIEIPLKDAIRTDPTGYRRLIELYYECKKHHNRTIFIDFSQLEWIDANLSSLLHAIFYKLNLENGLTFSIDIECVKEKFPILFRNGFLRNLFPMDDQYGTTVQLTTFKKNDDQLFIDYIENELLSNGGMKIKDDECQELVHNFLEVFTNVQLHAQTNEPIFACGQYFSKTKRLNFTLIDLGIGYLQPIEKFTNGKIYAASEAIQWALKGNSTKGDAPGGIGLKGIIDYCQRTKGDFNIVTGDAYWGNNLGINDTRIVRPFCGTMVHLMFNCS